jgi:hypothetical protein
LSCDPVSRAFPVKRTTGVEPATFGSGSTSMAFDFLLLRDFRRPRRALSGSDLLSWGHGWGHGFREERGVGGATVRVGSCLSLVTTCCQTDRRLDACGPTPVRRPSSGPAHPLAPSRPGAAERSAASTRKGTSGSVLPPHGVVLHRTLNAQNGPPSRRPVRSAAPQLAGQILRGCGRAPAQPLSTKESVSAPRTTVCALCTAMPTSALR